MLYQIKTNEDHTQFAWLSIIAIKDKEPGGNKLITDFFYLTRINGVLTGPGRTYLTPSSSSYECTLSIQLANNDTPTICTFSPIPTDHTEDNHHNEFLRYCTQQGNAQWSELTGFQDRNIFVLTPPMSQLTKNIDHTLPSPVGPSFTFPSLNLIEDRAELASLAMYRHKCTLIDCSEFLICPNTMSEPGDPPHKHCIHRFCVRFWEPLM